MGGLKADLAGKPCLEIIKVDKVGGIRSEAFSSMRSKDLKGHPSGRLGADHIKQSSSMFV